MEVSKKEINIIKGIAIIFLVFLHLFNTRDYIGIFKPILLIDNIPFVYYLSLVSGCCVSLFLFCSGYGLANINKKNRLNLRNNLKRIFKLLINYWIILIIFVLIGYILGYKEQYPSSIKNFLLNFMLLSKSYNGAWWFLQTYVILVLFSELIIKMVNKFNSYSIFFVSGLIYFIAFIISIKVNINFENNEILNILYGAIINFCTCQFSFILGGVFIKENIISKLRIKIYNYKYRQSLIILLSTVILVVNILIENYIIDPITAISVILVLSITKINKYIEKILLYISKHSTNIWLTHMFFYMIFFKTLVYYPKYPLLIFIWLFILCIASSYVIDLVYKFVLITLKSIESRKSIIEVK